MKHYAWTVLVAVLATSLAVGAAAAPRASRSKKKPQNYEQVSENSQEGGREGEASPEPEDSRLKELKLDFATRYVKLAKDYERAKDTDKARYCYEQILKLFPKNQQAEEALAKITEMELSAESKRCDVKANDGWQDTGVTVIKGKPIAIQATGNWTFKMSQSLGANGMEIPEELREFNLGCLVGIVQTTPDLKDSKPFMIGENFETTFEESGPLLMRMYDYDYSDNSGRLKVEITGTFDRRKAE